MGRADGDGQERLALDLFQRDIRLAEGTAVKRAGAVVAHEEQAALRHVELRAGADGDALLAELRQLVDTVPQITNRDENVAEIAAYRGRMLFYFDRDYYTLAELVHLPGKDKYSACVYIDADGSCSDRTAYAKNIAVQVDEWRRQNDIPFDKSTIAARPADADGGEFDTMDEALRYLYTCLNFPDSVLC